MATWKKVITEAHNSDYKNENVTVSDLGGGSGTTFLRKDGSWATPADNNTQLTNEQVQDIVGGMLVGTETRISVTYDDTNGRINFVVDDMNDSYTLPLSTSSVRGGIKIGYGENGKNYPVELSSEKAYVNVPWTDTNTTTTADVKTALNANLGSMTIGDSNDTITIAGNLVVSGDTTTLNVATLEVEDKTLLLAKGSNSDATADGAGIVLNASGSDDPGLTWYNDTESAPTSNDRLGSGWVIHPTTETKAADTQLHVMAFKAKAGAPSSGSWSSTTKAEGRGTFYYDTTNEELYLCTDSKSSGTNPS